MLDTSFTRLEFKNIIHSKPFCDIAKSTQRGYAACMRCKAAANRKGKCGKVSFSGYCIYGLYEVGYPVVSGGETQAIVYVGNAVVDLQRTRKQLVRAARLTGVSESALIEKLGECESVASADELYEIAEIVADYLKMLCLSAPREERKLHWLVSLLKEYAEKSDLANPSLKEIAAVYHKNEKYAGRLFKEQTGKSFSEYCSDIRISRAEAMIIKSEKKIIDIALESGFENVSYFNRLFRRKYGMSPTAYRKARGV
jgi:AraC-like DNA-binding protein